MSVTNTVAQNEIDKRVVGSIPLGKYFCAHDTVALTLAQLVVIKKKEKNYPQKKKNRTQKTQKRQESSTCVQNVRACESIVWRRVKAQSPLCFPYPTESINCRPNGGPSGATMSNNSNVKRAHICPAVGTHAKMMWWLSGPIFHGGCRPMSGGQSFPIRVGLELLITWEL